MEAANLLGEEQQAVEVAMAAPNIALRTGGSQVLHLHLHLNTHLHPPPPSSTTPSFSTFNMCRLATNYWKFE